MNKFRRSLTVVALLASVAGFQPAAFSATSSILSQPTRSVTGCCYVYVYGHWLCKPC